jgi:hypothetical protein
LNNEGTHLRAEINRLNFDFIAYEFAPPGHFYSPIPSQEEVRKNEQKIWEKMLNNNHAVIELHEQEQLTLFHEFTTYYPDLPFQADKSENLRYFFENPSYAYSDAIFLYCMIRHSQPRKIIEVGTGYSSCLVLDTNELFFNNSIETVFIQPYPELFLSLIKPMDKERITLIPQRLQDVPLSAFESLKAQDILLIDSSHVSKIGSDVNHLFFEILPALNTGVLIHFHDIFYPFEYPRDWIYKGCAWNENYILRAFLQYNYSFKIVFFNTFLEHFHKQLFEKEMPLCLKNKGGSIWIQKC